MLRVTRDDPIMNPAPHALAAALPCRVTATRFAKQRTITLDLSGAGVLGVADELERLTSDGASVTGADFIFGSDSRVELRRDRDGAWMVRIARANRPPAEHLFPDVMDAVGAIMLIRSAAT